MRNRSELEKGKKRFSRGKASLITTIVGSLGYFVIKDLKNENSLIKNMLKKIPYFDKTVINSNGKNEDDFRIIDDSAVTKIKK